MIKRREKSVRTFVLILGIRERISHHQHRDDAFCEPRSIRAIYEDRAMILIMILPCPPSRMGRAIPHVAHRAILMIRSRFLSSGPGATSD